MMTCVSSLKEELDCVLLHMRGVDGCFHPALPKSRGLWLGVADIRDFADTENIFMWVYDPTPENGLGCSAAELISVD